MFRYDKNVRIASFLSLSSSLWLSVTLTLAPTGSHCHCLALTLAHFCSLISLIQSLIGSQGPCSALSAAATLTHFFPVWNTLLCFDWFGHYDLRNVAHNGLCELML